MTSKKEFLKNFKLYAVTDLRSEDTAAIILKKIDDAYRGGADIVQLRAKKLSDMQILSLGKRIRGLADKYGKLFFVNDRADLAIACGADGVHVGQDDLPISEIRKINADLLIGKSTHSIEQALEAQKECPDYLGVGPVFATPTKPEYQPAGLEFVKQASEKITLPFVAIGGIDLTNIEQVLKAGAGCVAVVRAIFFEKDVYESSRNLRKKIEIFSHVSC